MHRKVNRSPSFSALTRFVVEDEVIRTRPRSAIGRRSRQRNQPHINADTQPAVNTADRLGQTMDSSILLDGLWWEWHFLAPSGWENFDATANYALEEAFLSGATRCRLTHRPTRPGQEAPCGNFDLLCGKQLDGTLEVRRVRMPQPCGSGIPAQPSLCSTVMRSEDLAAGSLPPTSKELTDFSVWTLAGNSSVVQAQVEGCGLECASSSQSAPSHEAAQTPSNSRTAPVRLAKEAPVLWRGWHLGTRDILGRASAKSRPSSAASSSSWAAWHPSRGDCQAKCAVVCERSHVPARSDLGKTLSRGAAHWDVGGAARQRSQKPTQTLPGGRSAVRSRP